MLDTFAASARLRSAGLRPVEILWTDRFTTLARAEAPGRADTLLVLTASDDRPPASVRQRLATQAASCRELGAVPHVVRLLEAGAPPDDALLTLADPGGMPLSRWSRRASGETLQLGEWLTVVCALAQAVEAVHGAGLIVKNLATDRVLVQPDGTVVLTDFGLASRMPREFQEAVPAGALQGALEYMAPEQTGRMARGIDVRSDLYALGCIGYELLVGRPPFVSADPLEVVHAHLAQEAVVPEPGATVWPPLLLSILRKLLAKEPADRYQTARGLRLDLERILAAGPSAAPWQAFALDQSDRSPRLSLPGHLYGREDEMRAIVAELQACGAGSRCVIVAGPSGIGKTALVRELQRPIARGDGILAQGKFEQYQRDIPFRGLARALQSLLRWLTQLPADDFVALSGSVVAALGDDRHVLTALVPALQRLLGSIEPLPPLSPVEAQQRQVRALRTLLRALVTPQRPLVLFLDDIQWADTASVELLTRLLEDRSIHGLLVVLSLRDDEVAAGHPLRQAVQGLRQAGVPVRDLALGPLSLQALQTLLADGLAPSRPDPALAPLLQRMAGGNPLHVREALEALVDRRVLRFDTAARAWSLDRGAALQFPETEGVLALVGDRIAALPPSSAQLLGLAAVVGSRFSIAQVAALAGVAEEEALRRLNPAIQSGLVEAVRLFEADAVGATAVEPGEPVWLFGFGHDRVHQAAYAKLADTERAGLHRQVGHMLLEQAGGAVDEVILRVVGHLNAALPVVTETGPRREIAALNAAAARRAWQTQAWAAARQCAGIGVECLGPWSADPDLALELQTRLAEAAALVGDLAALEGAAAEVARHAPALDRVRAQKALILGYAVQGRLLEAIDACREGLAWFGVTLPQEATTADLQAAFAAALAAMGKREPAVLADLPPVTDARELAILDLYGTLIAVAYIVSPTLFAWMILTALVRFIHHGNAPDAAFFYACTGMFVLSATQDVARAEAFAQLALTLAERTATTAVRGRTLFVVGASVSHFSHPFPASIAWLERSRPLLLEAGELEFAGYASYNLCQHRMLSGQPLDQLEPLFDGELQALGRLGLAASRRWCAVVRQLLRCLREPDERGVLDGRDFDAGAELPALREAGDDTALAIYHINALLLALLREDAEEARRQLVAARPCMHGLAEFPAGAAFRFLEPLALLRFAADAAEQRAMDDEVVTEHLRVLGVHARSNPGIFGHRLTLVEGLREAAAGRPAAALEAADAAMRCARDAGLPHEAALAAQAAAAVAQAWGKPALAADYRREARVDLERWGAVALVQRAEPGAIALAEAVAADHRLDFESLLKASRVLTGELRIEALPATLLGVVLENAGATLGALVFHRHGRWLVQRRGAQAQQASPPTDLDQDGEIPRVVVNQVINTHEPVFVAQVGGDTLLAADEVLHRRGVRSLLCLPIRHGAELLGALYLENRLIGEAFPAQRVAVLEVLCAQAGIALKNALLYSDLQRSEGRLRAIVENNVDIITIIDPQGRYAFASPALQRVLGYAESELLGRLAIEPIHPDDQPAAAAAIMRALATPAATETVAVRFRHRDGHWVDIEAVGRNLVHVPGVEGIVVNTRDISERRRAEATLRQLNDELEARVAQRTAELARTSEELMRAEKLASLGRLVAGLAHELNTPIGNAVLAASTLAGRQREFESGLTDRLRLSTLKSFLLDTGEASEVLERNLQRAAELIGSFKQLAVDQSSYQRRRFELGEVVQEIALALRPTLRRSGVQLVDETPSGLVMDSFPGPLGQVLANLVENAVVHAFAEGRPGTVRIAAHAPTGDRVRLTVADDGRGIAAEHLGRIFDPFFTTRMAQGGSGLGLHIVYSLVTGPLGGRIEVRSMTGEGTAFLVELPREAPRATEPARDAAGQAGR